jgi:hypothetical protein
MPQLIGSVYLSAGGSILVSGVEKWHGRLAQVHSGKYNPLAGTAVRRCRLCRDGRHCRQGSREA